MANSISHFSGPLFSAANPALEMPKYSPTGYEAVAALPEFPFMYKIVEYDGLLVPNHWHESLEILYIERGHMRVNIDGNKKDLYGHDFIIFNSYDIHSTRAMTNTKSCVLQLSPEFIRSVIPDFDEIYFESTSLQMTAVRGNPITDRIRSDLSVMRSIYERKSDGYICAFLSTLYDLLFLLDTEARISINPTRRTGSEHNRQILTEVTAFVRDNYSRHISLKEAAAVAGLQQEYFCRFFKRHMGMSFVEYVSEVRFNKVYEDLINTDLPVSEILERRGFTNYKLFMRIFRERFGSTPKRHRQKMRNNIG